MGLPNISHGPEIHGSRPAGALLHSAHPRQLNLQEDVLPGNILPDALHPPHLLPRTEPGGKRAGLTVVESVHVRQADGNQQPSGPPRLHPPDALVHPPDRRAVPHGEDERHPSRHVGRIDEISVPPPQYPLNVAPGSDLGRGGGVAFPLPNVGVDESRREFLIRFAGDRSVVLGIGQGDGTLTVFLREGLLGGCVSLHLRLRRRRRRRRRRQ
mmetsp:Transcript_43884/g.133664  ORF Transcript_43884/g.133664 Transcript_43884/m.133664 type:complete len:212 (+) Transcript_43884:267-902(+)